MRRFLLALLLLVACGSQQEQPPTDTAGETAWQRIGFGTDIARVDIDGVDCIVFRTDRGGSVDCDWPQG